MKLTQTDFCSSSALATSLLFRRRESRITSGLRLTQRSRSRLKGAGSIFCNMLHASDGVHTTPKNFWDTVDLIEDNNEVSGIMTTLVIIARQKSAFALSCKIRCKKKKQIKYIQTKLNSSFFLKSEHDTNIPKEPLVKIITNRYLWHVVLLRTLKLFPYFVSFIHLI